MSSPNCARPASIFSLTHIVRSFSMCTLWLVEALARAGQYNPAYLTKAIGILEVSLRTTFPLCRIPPDTMHRL